MIRDPLFFPPLSLSLSLTFSLSRGADTIARYSAPVRLFHARSGPQEAPSLLSLSLSLHLSFSLPVLSVRSAPQPFSHTHTNGRVGPRVSLVTDALAASCAAERTRPQARHGSASPLPSAANPHLSLQQQGAHLDPGHGRRAALLPALRRPVVPHPPPPPQMYACASRPRSLSRSCCARRPARRPRALATPTSAPLGRRL